MSDKTAPARERLSPQVRRQRILDTAMEIIAEEGYRGLSMRSLARRCGMSAPGVMHHFPDLPALLLAVLDFRDERDARAVSAHAGELLSGKDILNRIVQRMAQSPREAQLFAILETEALDPHHPAHDYFRERHARTVAQMEPYFRNDFENPQAAARRILAVLDGLQLHWLQDPEHFDLLEQWAPIADALFPRGRP